MNIDTLTQDLFVDAVAKGKLLKAEFLIRAGADVNASDEERNITALHIASFRGHGDMMRLLLSKGAHASKAAKDGCTPLHLAAEEGKYDAVQVLVDAGADINQADNDGMTPLHRAAVNGHVAIVKYLIRKGAEKDIVDRLKSSSPLWFAAAHGQAEVVKVLAQSGADVEKLGHMGLSPLLVAILGDHLAVVQLLVEKGADPNRISTTGDAMGVTPHLMAAQMLIEGKPNSKAIGDCLMDASLLNNR